MSNGIVADIEFQCGILAEVQKFFTEEGFRMFLEGLFSSLRSMTIHRFPAAVKSFDVHLSPGSLSEVIFSLEAEAAHIGPEKSVPKSRQWSFLQPPETSEASEQLVTDIRYIDRDVQKRIQECFSEEGFHKFLEALVRYNQRHPGPPSAILVRGFKIVSDSNLNFTCTLHVEVLDPNPSRK